MENIKIRKAELSDTEQILEIYSYYVRNTAITFEYDVPDKEEFQERIRKISGRYPYLVAEQDGRIVGYAYAGTFKDRKAYDWAVELTVYVDKDCRKGGIGKMLYEQIEKILKQMGITNLYACIGVPEAEDEYLTRNSIEFHEHLGFKQVGEFHNCGYKFDRWYNMVWAEKIIGEHRSGQADIINFNEL